MDWLRLGLTWHLLRGPSSVVPVLNKGFSSAHLSSVTYSTCGTECWEASSTRISGLGKARASALLPHSMRKSGRGLRVSLAEHR